MAAKLFLICRDDLKPGQQAVQIVHALSKFEEEHREVYQQWYRESNTLAFLRVPDELMLELLHLRALSKGIEVAVFREPDLADSITAIAIGPKGKRITGHLPKGLCYP